MAAWEEPMPGLTAAQRELVELWLDSGDEVDTPRAYAAPSSDTERRLAGIWAEVLEQARVGLDDDYFMLGGDSITAIVVIAKARAAGLQLGTQDLLGLRTIRAIAATLDADRATVAVDAASALDGRLTPMQEGMLADILRDPAAVAYVAQVSARLDGELDLERLHACWQSLAQRHWALRVSVHWDGERLRQEVHGSVEVAVEVVDLSGLTAADQDARVRSYLAVDRRRGFDVSRAPLWRMGVLRLSPTACRLVFTHHHLLLDGWSQQIVLREFFELYDGRPALKSPPASELPIVRDTDDGSRYWRERLAGFTPTPVVHGRGSGAGSDPDRYMTTAVTLSASTSEGLSAAARAAGVTAPTLVYAGWSLLAAGLAGTDDIAFGVTVSGRSAAAPGAADAVGMFINTLPLRVRIGRGERLTRWLTQLHRWQAELLEVQQSSLPHIARCLPQPLPARELFDTIVVVENFPQPVREGSRFGRLRVSDVTTHIVEGYPLVLEANLAPPMRLSLRADTTQVPATTAEALLARLISCVQELATGVPEQMTVGELARLAAADPRAARRQPVRLTPGRAT